MPRFFDNVQLKVLKGQIYIKEQEVSSLKDLYERANINKDTLSDQLREARGKLYDLEEQHKNKHIECEKKLQEVQKIMSDRSKLASDLPRMLNEVEVAKRDLEEKRNRNTSLHQEMLSMKNRMQDLQERIKQYDAEINQPEPQPQLRTGNYCVNGHLHCPNLPNDQIRTVLIPPSQEEISQYRQRVERARALKAELVDELAGLQNQYRHLGKECSSSDSEYQSAVSHLNECQQQVENQQKEIAENEELSKQKQQEYNGLLEEENRLNEAIEKNQITANNLSNELTSVDAEVATARTRWMDAELELDRLNEQYKDMEFEARRNRIDASVSQAMTNFEMNEGSNRKPASYGNVTLTSPEEHNEPTQQQKQEEYNSEMEMLELFADRLVDGAIEAAQKSGAISEQVKRNLRFIRNFGNEVLNDAKKKFDNAIHDTLEQDPDTSPAP